MISSKEEDQTPPPIGGYFELELPRWKNSFFDRFYKFQSARSAFFALLRSGHPQRVWVPKYICNAMLAPLKALNIEYIFYDIDNNLNITPTIKIQKNDWLLYVNYFGICDQQVEVLFSRINPRQIILDYSQAFFSPHYENVLATIYSPRKFFGIPDGGLLHSHIAIEKITEINTTSFLRTEHLLHRLGRSPEYGYKSFLAAEDFLSTELEPQKMSTLTWRIFQSIDFEEIREKRKKNFHTLHRLIQSTDTLLENINKIEAPLIYPYFTPSAEKIRTNLIKNRIFIPTYWSDASHRLERKTINRFIKNMLPLPIDQRYGKKEMERIASIVKE